jgi:hypothetical protein
MTDLYLGGPIDSSTGDRIDGARIDYDASDLTTHGVIVGMTGSGKTGLGVIFLEEALRSGLPALVIDPKGDMTNLLLTFPELRPSDFRPWIDEAAANKDGRTPDEAAEATADLWRNGLAGWDLSGDDIGELRAQAGFAIYTPGSTAGIPLNVVGSLVPPPLDWDDDAETLRDEIQGFTSGLLGLIDVEADPISSREHILIANLIEYAWRNDQAIDMATLLGWIQRPPIRKLGVFEIDTFYPESDRIELAMQLNGLMASPSFASWMEGTPLEIPSMLWDDEGRPRAAILYIAHLSDQERQFVVTLALSKLITWMRSQPGSGELRMLTYMDEVFGFVPPTAVPPAKKPILTLLKEARAFGVGMLLSTQNPVDLDYKAMSNAGTWCVGRLQTERDKARIVEALSSARGDVDVAELDTRISGLAKRRFLLHNTREKEPQLFATRWAMSYLRGPLTRDQIETLTGGRPDAAPTPEPTPSAAGKTETIEDDARPVMPITAEGVRVAHLDPAAGWAEEVGADPTANRWEAALAVRVSARYDETRAGVDHLQAWEAIYHPLAATFDAASAIEVDYEPRDFAEAPSAEARYVLPDASIDSKAYFRTVASDVKEYLDRGATVTIFRNPSVKLYSRVGETEADFAARCDQAADAAADAAVAKLRDKYEARLRTIQREIDEAARKADSAAADLQAGQQDELLSQAGTVFDLLMGRRSRRSLSTASKGRRAAERRLRTAEDRAETKSAELLDLEAELEEEIAEISDQWDEKAGDIEALEIGLEKNDITVDEVAVVWIPRS